MLARVLDTRGHVVTLHDSAQFCFTRDARDAQLLCICGGDGTARLVLEQQDDLASLPPLAIYPTGTINLLARELAYPSDAQAFAARIESATQPRPVTIARAGDMHFLACASVGFDANAVAAVSPGLKARIGRLACLVALLTLLRRWPRQQLQVTADGESFTAEAVFVLRGALYVGPWTLDQCPPISDAGGWTRWAGSTDSHTGLRFSLALNSVLKLPGSCAACISEGP